jgi:hypothetical protein
MLIFRRCSVPTSAGALVILTEVFVVFLSYSRPILCWHIDFTETTFFQILSNSSFDAIEA